MGLVALKRLKWAVAAAIAVGCVFSYALPSSAGVKLHLERVVADDFDKSENPTIKLYFDVLDDDDKVVEKITDADITVMINGQVVGGTATVEYYEATKQDWLAVAILMAGHRSYRKMAAELDDEGNEIDAGGIDTFALEKKGFIQFVERLKGNGGSSDQVGVWLYNSTKLQQIKDFNSGFEKTAAAIETKAMAEEPDLEGEKKGQVIVPSLYKHIRSVLKKFASAEALEPYKRRILVIMTDGKDKKVSRSAKRAEKEVKQSLEAADLAMVKIYAIGFTPDDTEPLAHIETIARRTNGVYREIAYPENQKAEAELREFIPDSIRDIADQLKKQYVVTFAPNLEQFRGSEEPVTVRVEAKTPDGPVASGEQADVKIPYKSKSIWVWLKWVIIGVGGLLGLIILIKIIKAIANRPKKEVYYEEEEDEGPSGPYKGKLAVQGGAMVGKEFYLTEDVTTIGALEGNGVVLEDAGVSKRHAGIKIEDMRFELADFGSTNGTYVNGVKITKQFLRDGDEIQIGDAVMKFTLK